MPHPRKSSRSGSRGMKKYPSKGGQKSESSPRPKRRRESEPTKRVFLAYELPDDLKTNLCRLQKDLFPHLENVKWVRPEVMHLTLAFLGDIPLSLIERLQTLLRETAPVMVGAKHCEVRGLGAFPDWRRPSTIWVGVGKGAEAIIDSERILTRALRGIGIKGEMRAYTPHLTLGRIRPPLPLKNQSFVDAYQSQVHGRFEALELTLFESELHAEGPVHSPIERYELF